MPNSGRYPCGNCNYVAASRRMLSRHTAIAHAAQAFKCPLCPFVSCYQANLYRHKRDIHGLGRMTACEICGFFSSSIEDLIDHKENNHQDQIEWLKKKYANERVRLGVEIREEDKSTDGENISVEKETEIVKSDCKSSENHENTDDVILEDQNADEDFTKFNDTSGEMKSGQLGPIKIRRSYTCEECGLTTIDPRQYLYHRRDVHGEKMTVHECKHCIYASRHVQKLQRHCALVHRQQMQIKKNVTSKNVVVMDLAKESSNTLVSKVIDDVVDNWKCVTTDDVQVNATVTEKQLTARKTMPVKLLKCSECSFEAYNNLHLLEHEKDVHRRKKDYECGQCGYDTNNKSRFTRHQKYHDVPKLKCNFCDFKTPYKWNMDRHLRNHVENGEYECTKCSFKTHAKQSLTVHLDYHHGKNAAFNSKAKRPRLQTARKQMSNHETFDEFYSNNIAFKDYIVDDDDDVNNTNLLDDDMGTVVVDDENTQKNSYSFHPSSEINTQKQSMYGSAKQHSCPICNAKFNQLSMLGQHLKEGHPESADASNIAAVVDMLSPQRHKVREVPISTSFSDSLTSKKSQLENKDRSVPTCRICGYKTRWASELHKHERVHSGEKPFECHICEYKCKWKGDLTRHLQKSHKKKQQMMPKVCTSAEEDSSLIVPNHKQACETDDCNSEDLYSSISLSFNNDQDSPLDLTVTKKLPELVLLPALLGNINRSVSSFQSPKENSRISSKQNSFPIKRQLNEYDVINEPPSKIIKKYKCTFCDFMTRTASRFHVHMVQHFDKRPFVCSACGYRSNWQWDITKHIKMKSARDDSHANAILVITEQTCEKNYEKYKSYLVDVEENKESKRAMRISSRAEKKRLHHNEDNDEDDNNCSDMTSVIDEPENIVVTPDLPFTFEDPNQSRPISMSANDELVLEPYQSRPDLNNTVVSEPAFERYKLFHCKHCSYKHREKKVVVSHLAVHAGIKLFRCRVCGVSSNWKNVILRHVKTHHSGQLKYVEELITYTVEGHVVCLTGIKKQQENINSSSISSPRKDSTRRCTICPYTCLKENHFQFHMKQHQPREGACFKCIFCPYYVKFRKTLIRHLELHKNEKAEPAQCMEEDSTDPAELFINENCDNEFSVDIQNQEKSANDWSYDEKEVSCKDNIYFREKRHSCEQCPYKTDNKTQYLYHKQFHRPNKSAKFKCKLCSYWATHHHLIAQHLKVHNTEQPLQLVDVQSDQFVQSSQEMEDNQSVEIPVDNDENRQIRSVVVKKGEFYFRMFKCNYCPMMNKRRANVRVHEKMHSKSKVSKYVCPLCNYKCNNQGIITAHMKVHGKNSESFVSGHNNDIFAMENITEDTKQSLPLKRKRVFSYFCMKCPAVFKSTADMQIHKTFHGMSYPLPCPSCDYRAKNKAHLHKHLLVHTPEYVAKREASYGPPVMTTIPETSCMIKSSEANQMLLLEDAEMKAVMEGNVIPSPQKLHRCTLCPVAFFKATTLQYHLSLHGSNGEHICSYCNYAVDKNENLTNHEKFHISPPKLVKPKALTMFFSCPKCPAVFDKVNRYNRHFQLHGQKNKYTCEHCDYSVRLPANLFNHKIVHTKSYAERKQDINFISQDTSFSGITVSLERKNLEEAQKKRSFVCDRCPYFYMRKDAVQRHQRRHNSGGGGGCPYCDYNSLQLSFLRDHVRVHFQSESPFEAQAFMKHEEYEIWSVENGKREILFKDNGAHKLNNDRFFPPLDKELEDLYVAEGDAPNDLFVTEYKEMDNIPNKYVPVVDPVSFSADLEQLSALHGFPELSSHDPTSNSDNLIEDALNQSKKLEVILTDVFSPGNKAAVASATNNEVATVESNIECDTLFEERNLFKEEQVSPMLVSVECDAETEENSEQVEENNDHQHEGTAVNLAGLQCEMISSDALVLPHTNDINVYVIKSENEIPMQDEDYEISYNNCCTLKEELFTGTNSSSFDAEVAENEKLEHSSSSDYFDTRKKEFINQEDIVILDSASAKMEWKTDITNDILNDRCDNITDVEVTVASNDQLIENVSETLFLDTATMEKCHRNGLMPENDSNKLPDCSLPM